MVLKKRYIYRISFLVTITFLFSCDALYYIDCNDCISIEPASCQVEVIIGAGSNQDIPFDITVYLGKIEDGIVIDTFTSNYSGTFNALINNEYSATAVAVINDKEYRVVNSTTPVTELVQGMCETDCFTIKKNSIDLRLKYQ